MLEIAVAVMMGRHIVTVGQAAIVPAVRVIVIVVVMVSGVIVRVVVPVRIGGLAVRDDLAALTDEDRAGTIRASTRCTH